MGIIDNIIAVTQQDYLFFPGDYFVITEEPAVIKRNYLTKNPENLIKVSSLPSMNDDEGHVILINENGHITDRVDYKDDWQFKLITDAEGVSLERINCNRNSQDEHNWHSASSSAGFGTPTYKNSQSDSEEFNATTITVEPNVISPDNDGIDDFASIHYSFDEPGYVANVFLFDAYGRNIKQLQRSALCGRSGQFIWDGLNNNNQKLPTGVYIIYTEVFNLQGKVRKYKNTIVVKE